MKGPFERLKYDLRRVWECPACHHRERSNGTVTTLWCACREAQGGLHLAMRLIEDDVRRVLPPVSTRSEPRPDTVQPETSA